MTLDDVVATWSRPDILALAALGLCSTLFWRVPILGLAFYPFRLLNTFVHELSHGFAALLTGGRFDQIEVYRNREGVARIRGGNRAIVVSAGYLGSALFGGALILLTATTIAVQTLLLALGMALALLCLAFVRNGFGFVAGVLLAVGLAAAGWYLPTSQSALLFALLAIHMPLAAVNNLVDLMQLSVRPPRPDQLSDAQVMARYTHVPAVVWATVWCLAAIAIILVTVTIAYRDTAVPLLAQALPSEMALAILVGRWAIDR